ncbi:hypothetical protein [Gordonia sputi]
MPPADAEQLFTLWRTAHRSTTPEAVVAFPTPGLLAQRCFFEAMAVGDTVGRPASEFDVEQSTWDQVQTLITEGDEYLRANDSRNAIATFGELIDSHSDGQYPLARIEGLIGRGNAHRQAEDVDSAIADLRDAIALADDVGYEYGLVRAQIFLGYLHIRVGSAHQAAAEFASAAKTAAPHGWLLDQANALLGLGEAADKAGELRESLRALLDAHVLFTNISSPQGIANCTLILADVCRRQRWTDDAAGWFRQTITAASAAGMTIALANAHDGLGECLLADGQVAEAVANHQEALRLSDGYPRGQAHAVNGLARCAFAANQWQVAINLFTAARTKYLVIDDLTGAATSETGIARSHEQLAHDDDPDIRRTHLDAAVEHRLAAVGLVEQARAAQATHAHQGEYYQRFSRAHEMALRTAVDAQRPDAFISVFESVVGRRLAGLLEAAPENTVDAQLMSQLVLEADANASKRKDRTRMLGGIAVRSALPPLARADFDDALAALYSPFDPASIGDLLECVDLGDSWLLLLAPLREPHEIAMLLLDATGNMYSSIYPIDDAAWDLLVELYRDGLSLKATPDDVAILHQVLHPDLFAIVPSDTPLVIVPAGSLWAVPWAALPVRAASNELFLGERNPLCISPSVTMIGKAGGRLRDVVDARVRHWKSPEVDAHGVVGGAEFATAQDCRAAILRGSSDEMVIAVAHGRPVRELVHYIELDVHTALTPADMLGASPPGVLALISCWGSHSPDHGAGDPLSIATLALARGSRAVVASSSEMLDDGPSSMFVNWFLHESTAQPLPRALQSATLKWLRHPDLRRGELSRWAPLTVLGTW